MSEQEKLNWKWLPGMSVGPFLLGEPLSTTWQRQVIPLPPSMEDAEWSMFAVGDEEARLAIENGRVTGIECFTSLLYEGNELIGANLTEVSRWLPDSLVMVQDYKDGSQRWEADELGLMIWVGDGFVESVTIFGDLK